MRSYRPEELFDDNGRLVARPGRAGPAGRPADGRQPPGQRRAAPAAARRCPTGADYAVEVAAPGHERAESTRRLGELLRDVYRANGEPGTLPAVLPRRDQLQPAGRGVRGRPTAAWSRPRRPTDDHVSPDGRVMEVLSEHLCHGWLEGYTLTGRHGLFATYEAFAMVSASMTVQHSKWLEAAPRACPGAGRCRR